MKNLLLSTFAVLLLICNAEYSYCQDDNEYKERNWQLEVEPSAYLLKGYSFQVGRYLTESKNLSLGIYSVSSNVPETLKQNMFSNSAEEDNLRIGLQIALNTRYKFDIFKGRESNPYVGLITGWENLHLTNPAKQDLKVDVVLLTPYVGAEIYFFKNILYVNPQLRAVTYLSKKYSVSNREETLKNVLLLPQISLGFRL